MKLRRRIKQLKDRLGLLSSSADDAAAHRRPQSKAPPPPPVNIEEIYVHIGSHKTGSSAIQLFLNRNAERLRQRLNLAVVAPHPWPLQFNAREARMDFSTEGFKILDVVRAPRILLTHEVYSWIYDPEDLKALHDTLKSYCSKVKIVVYLRRQDALAISMKQEGTKWVDCSTAFGHELQPFPSELSNLAENYLRFDEKIARWADAFGKDNIIIRVFEPRRLKNKDAVADFMQVLGEDDISEYQSVGVVNASLTRRQQLFLHQTRGQFHEQTPAKRTLSEIIRAMDLGDKEKLMPSKDEAEAFYAQFREGNARLNQAYNLTDDENLFSDDFSKYPEKSNWTPLDHADIIGIFEKVMVEVAFRLEGLQPNQQIERTANWLRGEAMRHEGGNMKLALSLMKQAHRLRPAGPFIKRKIAEYERALSEN